MSDSEEGSSYRDEDEEYSEEEAPRPIRNSRRPINQDSAVTIGQNKLSKDQKTFTLSDAYGMIDREDIEMLDHFTDHSLNLIRSSGDDSLLMKACYKGSINCVQYMIDVGIDINYQARDGVTALINCAHAQWSEKIKQIIQKLILAGADPNIRNNDGYTVLDLAFSKKKVELIRELIELGANPSKVKINGMGPLEYVLTTRGMDSLIELMISRVGGDNLPLKKLMNLGKRGNGDNIFHLLAGKDTPYLRQILVQEEKRIESERAAWLIEQDQKQMAKAASQVTDLSDEVMTGHFDSSWLFDLDEEKRNYQIEINNSSELEKIMESSLQTALLQSDQNGKTPLAIAIETNQIDNVELFVEFGRIELNSVGALGNAYNRGWFMSPSISLPIELAINNHINGRSGLEMIKKLFELGAELSDKHHPDWIEWYLSQMRGNNREVLDLIFNQKKDQVIQDKRFEDRNGCDCTVFMRAIRLRHYGIVENMLLNRKQSEVRLDHRCQSEECYGQYGPFGMFMNQLLRAYSVSSFDVHDFRILHLFLKQGVGGDPRHFNEKYHLTSIRSESLAMLLYNFGVKFTGNRLRSYRRTIHKYLVCYGGFQSSVRNQLDPETNQLVEYVTDEPISEIGQEDFILLESGIVWNVETLFNYLTMTVHGVNKYDSRSPWPGEQILTGRDLQNLEHHSNPLGFRIYQYFNVSSYLKLFDGKFIEQLKYHGSIFRAKGEPFDIKIVDLLDQKELEEWNEVRNFESNNAMPRISNSIAKKIEVLKKDHLGMFYEIYQGLTGEQKEGLAGVNEHLYQDKIELMFIGKECIMTMGYYMVQAHQRLTQWKPNKD